MVLISVTIGADADPNQFDDLVANPLLPLLSPIPTPYLKLAYNTFTARNDTTSIVKARSGQTTANTTPLTNRIQGSQAAITSDYPGSSVPFFDLKSVYVACAVMTQAPVGVPQACTVQFKTTKPDGKLGSQLCTYRGTLTDPGMAKCEFSEDFRRVKYVSIDPVDTLTLPETTVFLMDDVEYKVYRVR